ncbi:MAG: hypothetical protein ACERKZ_06610 [Lachnotalea sp.]
MKKKMVKMVQVVALTLALTFSLAACSKTPTNELNGFYESTEDVGFMSAYPDYTYKQATFSVETIETYADNTYCLTNTSTTFSGTLAFNDDGTHDEVPRGSNVTKYYGTFTSQEEEGLNTLTLSAPTSIIANISFATSDTAIGYLNTNAWTDVMGTSVGTDGGSLTAEEYLAANAFPEATVIVDTINSSFDYSVITAAK